MKIYHDQGKLVRAWESDDKILKYVKTNYVAKSTGFINFRELTLVMFALIRIKNAQRLLSK